MSSELTIWWIFLCTVTTLNIVAWSAAAWLLGKRQGQWPTEIYAARWHLLWLSAAYVLGCGFRSVLPMIEVPNICLHDLWLSRVIITRSIATVAEICFVLQWAILLREAGVAAGSRLTFHISRLLIPVIILAELFCWYAVLTTTYLPHALENALWTVAAILTVAAFIALWPRVGNTGRRFLAAAIAGGTSYVAFMVIIDVPMYLSRWQADLMAGREARPMLDGLNAILHGCVVQNDWEAWREDAVWLSLYFTFGVWASIALSHFPALRRAPEPKVNAQPVEG